MAFKFRLETLLRLKKRYLELAEAELARLLKQLSMARKSFNTKLTEVRQTELEMEDVLRKGVSADQYQQMFYYLERLKGDLSRLRQRIRQLEGQVQRMRETVAERHREKELVERLREKEYEVYKAEVQRQEQIEADDLFSVSFARRENETGLV